MRALILFLTGWYAGGKYLPLVTKAFDLYDEYENVTAKPEATTAIAKVALESEVEKQWMDRAGNPNAGGG